MVRTTCPYCGIGCGVVATPDRKGGAAIEGDALHPANRGRLCSKGAALGETLGLDDRLLYPEIDGRRVSWEAALDTVAGGLRETIDRHGPDAVAFYSGHVDFEGTGTHQWKDTIVNDGVPEQLMPPLEFFERYSQTTGLFGSMSFCCVPKRVLDKMGDEPFKVSGVEVSN